MSFFLAGSTHRYTVPVASNPSAELQVESLEPDPGYYNYGSYPSYDYDAVYPATASQGDRQDIGLFGGLGAGVIAAAVAAAFIGSMLAPAISAGVGRVFSISNMEFKLPELPFRALRYGKHLL